MENVWLNALNMTDKATNVTALTVFPQQQHRTKTLQSCESWSFFTSQQVSIDFFTLIFFSKSNKNPDKNQVHTIIFGVFSQSENVFNAATLLGLISSSEVHEGGTFNG